MSGNPFWQYWAFHLPNYALAVLVYTLIGRFVLGLFLGSESDNYIYRWFRRLTDPVLRLVDPLTPAYVARLFLPLVAVVWLTLARIVFWQVAVAAGFAPTTTG